MPEIFIEDGGDRFLRCADKHDFRFLQVELFINGKYF